MKLLGKELTFNNNKVYHAGNKPTPSDIGAAATSHGTHVTWATAAPKANGTAAVGTVARVAREDHVHPLQTTVSGNAGTATKLQTARTITLKGNANGNVSFDGSGNVTISTHPRIFSGAGTSGTSGYVAFAQIVVTANYVNRPIEFKLISRGRATACTINIAFANTNNTDPGLSSLRYWGSDYGVFAHKTATSTWLLYCTKSEAYDEITLVGHDYASQGVTVTYPGSFITTKPTADVTNASIGGNFGHANTANSATKSTQDSAGQQINTTYIKGLSVSGKTITYTKGDGTTGTITTQDTNTTYSTGTASALGLTKLYTGTGTATDGTITQKAITEQLNKTAKIMDGNTSNMYTWSGEYIANNYLTYSDTAAAAKKIKDYHDNGDITISYVDSDVSTASWFAAWDGRKLKTISASNLRGAINAADYYRIKTEGDNRGVNTTPNVYSNEFSFKGLKQGSTIGLTNATYSYLFGLRGWNDSSGGKSHELAFNDNGIWTRRGATTSWEAWQKLITSKDATFDSSVRFNDTFIKKASGVKSCCINLYANPDRLEFFWASTAGGEDWTWSNKSYIDANGVIYAGKQLSAAGHRITPYSNNGVSIIRPDGQEFSGLEVKELWIGPYSGQTRRLSMSASAPSSPTKGDVWIQNN